MISAIALSPRPRGLDRPLRSTRYLAKRKLEFRARRDSHKEVHDHSLTLVIGIAVRHVVVRQSEHTPRDVHLPVILGNNGIEKDRETKVIGDPRCGNWR